jgi:pantothenate kinase
MKEMTVLMHKKRYTVTGLSVEASYTSEEVTDIFQPLLQKLVNMRAEKGDRVLVYLAAPPGAGKTTLSLFLEDLYKEIDTPYTFQSVSMDGFHHYNHYLDSHMVNRNNQTELLRRFKGIPESFDVNLLKETIQKLQNQKHVYWPTYDRLLHDVSDKKLKVEADIILIEGNYLLLDKPVWNKLKGLSDYTIAIKTPLSELEKRLIDRKQKGGATLAEAKKHVKRTDKPNTELVLEHSQPADYNLILNHGKYEKITPQNP